MPCLENSPTYTLPGYDLLKGPMRDLASDSDKVDTLLEQAKTLADSLSVAFDTKSGVPEGDVVLNPNPSQIINGKNSIAGFGTLVLEWTHLSDLTGDDKYAKLVKKAEEYLIRPTGSPEAFPGLVGYQVSTETGEFLDSRGGWGGGTDSFYEYLIKMYLYDPKEFAEYKDRWVLAADSSIKHLKSHPTTREDLTFLAGFDGPKTIPSSGHRKFFIRMFSRRRELTGYQSIALLAATSFWAASSSTSRSISTSASVSPNRTTQPTRQPPAASAPRASVGSTAPIPATAHPPSRPTSTNRQASGPRPVGTSCVPRLWRVCTTRTA